ncbi:tenascin-X-like isoform X5 [Anguilla rostrata]|uniref:tenascin-X-like isoform X5 n=1 Tax=Anguilla rostrata TaxID=7938 RepID=UPI0030D08EEE
MGLFPTLVLLLLPCPALLTPPTGSRPSAARGPPESSETAPIQSPLTPPKPAPDLPSSGKPSQDVKPRAARDAGPSPNCTQQPIRVLISETSIQKDTSGKGEGDGPTLELEPGSPLVLTHRISLVPAPGACGGGCEAQVAALRERVERLEREVSALREKCGDTEGGCCTSQQSTGVHCTMQPGDLCPNDCSDQGRCDQGKCICFPGFSGPDCSSTTCPSNCNNRGTCVNGQCLCETGFTGSDCSENSCPNNCNNKGQCVNGQCVCDSGFMGTDCSAKSCPNNCKNNGKCVNGKCVCNSGFTGTDCSAKSCPSNCSNRGRCVNGQCVCDSGFMGTDCSAKSCPNNCNNNGKCVNGKCVCNSGFTGTDCSAKSCPSNCSNRGRCVNGQCVCDSGFTGADCSAKSCPNNCNNNGKCVNGKCVCDTGFTGTDCSEKSCPNNCNNNGKCVNGKCVCDTGFTGTDCSEKSCPNNCNNNGKCVNGKCVCNSGFTGTDCSAKSCPSNCSNRGRCVNGQCVCNSGFTGADCSAKSCPNNCNNNGKCVNGKCVCNNGFMGTDCSAKSCPNKCRNKGHCVNGQCICNDGFTGPDCSEKSCPNNCSDNGRCIKGKCVCNSGFTGTDCSEKTCPNKCRNKGHCVNGQCICNDGFTGPDCSEKSCPNNCSDNGRCVKGKCVCNSGFTGTDCSKKSCPNNCRNRGRCVNGECVCDSGFTGTDCSEKSCPNNCNNNGRCENGKCVCNSGFTGTDCSAKSCPNHCSDQGRCVDGKCVCNSGFTGPDCSTKSCPSDCSDQGRCVDGKCVCEPGFSGQDCSAKSCPNDCSDKGQCVNGRCVCHHGFTGPDCSQCEEGFTGEDCSTALTGVSQLGTRNITDSSVTMFWTPPSIQYDVYFITFTSKKEGNQKITSKVGGRLTSYTQTGLAAGQEYDVSIRGEKDGKMGAESTTEFMTLISGPKNLRVVKTTTTSVIVQWEPPLADIDRYHLSISASQSEGGEPGRQEMTLPPKRDSAHITGLEAGRLYDITLVSEKGMSQSQPIKVEAIPGPEPPSDLSFSNVTESSLIVSWAKPKSPVSGFKVTYTHSREGEPISVAVDSKNSTVPLSQLSPGSTYEVSVISLLGLDESDPVKGLVVTLPDPPTDLRAINVSHNKALLLWRPALATVDSYIIVYGSEQAADVRIKVSGNAAEHQLKGLRGATQYSVTVASQLGGQQSAGTSTVFTTVEGTDERGGEGPRKLTANNVTPRSAVLSWKPPSVAVTGYKLTYQTAGEEAKEVTLDPSVTQYKLTRLSPKSKYTVHLRGERRGQYTSPSSTEFTTGTLRFPFPSDCSQELLNGVQESGEAEIFLAGKRGGAVPVYCDMETDGGGWTVFQRRVDGRTNFFRSWKEYSAGFGSLSGEFWLGNELLHNLTSKVPMAMRVDLRVGAELAFAQYSSFSVDTQRRYYAIRVSGYSGTAGDSMAYHDQRPFSTWDRDPNPFITRCSMSYRGGWWYKNCHEANLNGLYDTHTNHQGVIWTSWKGKDFSIPFAEMKIRPASFTPPAQG